MRAVVGQATEAGFSGDGDVSSARSYAQLDRCRARDGALSSVYVAHHVQQLT